MIALATILLLLATIIGAWRHFNSRIRAINKANTPLAWTKISVRFGSLLCVIVFSLVGATILSVWISESSYWIGRFLWGAILMARWQVSVILCYVVLGRVIEAAEKDNKEIGERAASRIAAISYDLTAIREKEKRGETVLLTEYLDAGEDRKDNGGWQPPSSDRK